MSSARPPRIAVVGAGLGGLACARALQQHGREVTVLERDPSPDDRWQGGMLDLHVGTGQAALRAAGLYDGFAALARPEAQELRALDPVTGALLHHEGPRDDAGSAPEIDRGQLRHLLLDALTPGTVRWGCRVQAVTALDGTARLHLDDGTAEEVDLVVGADGAWSRVRPAVSGTTPHYWGSVMIESYLDDVDTRRPALAELVGPGTLVAKTGRTLLSAQRNSGGHLRVYAAFDAPLDWHVAAGVDLADPVSVRGHLLGRFAGWHESLRELLRYDDGGYVQRVLHVLPVDHRWDHVPGVTLLGDAAHLMPPYGIGANLALRDGADLAAAVAGHETLDDAVRAYEAVLLPRSTAAARACEELTVTMAAEQAQDVDAARDHLNASLRRAGDTAAEAPVE